MIAAATVDIFGACDDLGKGIGSFLCRFRGRVVSGSDGHGGGGSAISATRSAWRILCHVRIDRFPALMTVLGGRNRIAS